MDVQLLRRYNLRDDSVDAKTAAEHGLNDNYVTFTQDNRLGEKGTVVVSINALKKLLELIGEERCLRKC